MQLPAGLSLPSVAVSFLTLFVRWRVPQVPHHISSPGFAMAMGFLVIMAFPELRLITVGAILLSLGAAAFAVEWQLSHPAPKAPQTSSSKGAPSAPSSGGTTISRELHIAPGSPPQEVVRITTPDEPKRTVAGGPPSASTVGTSISSSPSPLRSEAVDPAAQVRPQASMDIAIRRAARTKETAPPQTFWNQVGCAFPQGVPDKVTAYDGKSKKDLIKAADALGASLHAADLQRKAKLAAALATGRTVQAREAALEAANAEATVSFQSGLLLEARPLHDELLKRLQQPYPTTTADGLGVGAYSLLCQGLFRGEASLPDLAAYLKGLARQLQ
jgi:hypothetical protein